MPKVKDLLNIICHHAADLGAAVEQVNVTASGTPYLPSWRAIRSSQQSIDALYMAICALDYQDSFTKPLTVDGRWCRPIDLVRNALESILESAEVIAWHQGGNTPAHARQRLSKLARQFEHVAHDIRCQLGPAVERLSFPHSYHAY